MKVIIDGLAYFLNKGELGDYTRSIINTMAITKEDKIILIKDREIIRYKNYPKGIDISELYINRINNDYKSIYDYINNTNCDIYHCTNNGFSIQREYKYNCKITTTVHSIIPDEYEEFYNIKFLEKYYSSMQLWELYSNLIIVPTNYIRFQLTSKFGIDENKITVLHPLVEENYTKQSYYMSRVYIKSKYNFTGDFLLFNGDMHKRKRLENFLEIFLRISTRVDNLYFVIMSSISNINYEYYLYLKEIIDSMGITNKVIFISDFNKADKIHFYNITKGVIDFSLYEGFTMSLLEAKKCNAKIICSDIPVYRELLGDYPLYLDLKLPFIDEILEEYIESERMEITQSLEDEDIEQNLSNIYKEILI